MTPMVEEEIEATVCSLAYIVHTHTYGRLTEICLHVIRDPRFQESPASSISKDGHSHHAYRGGLAVHTLEVTQNALAMAEHLDVNYEVLVTAAIVHDYCKIHEYVMSDDGSIEKTQYSRLVKHIAGSHAEFLRLADLYGYNDDETRIGIQHAILAHHGRLEWESPVEPLTPESMVLHYADMLSAKWGKGRYA